MKIGTQDSRAKPKEKTLFIFLRLGTSHRNILRTEVIETLLSCPELRIVVVSPLGREAYFREEISSKGLIVEPVPKTRVGFVERRLKKLKGYLWLERAPSSTFKIKRNTEYGRWGLWWRDCLARGLRRLGVTEEKINQWEIALFTSRKVKRLYDCYRPDAVLFTKLFSTKIHMVKEAKKRGIQTICFVEGWDNLNSKGPLAVTPDSMIVWNEGMKEEASGFHGIPPDRIEVVGIPEFDIYRQRSLFMKREDFFRHYGLDPHLKLITYAVAGGTIAPREPEIIELFYQAMMAGRIKSPCQILLRLHPNTRGKYLQAFDRFKGRPRITVQPAGRVARIQDGWDPSWEDMVRLGETMLYSDVVATVGSTICLDAIAFDTPVVGVGFEGTEPNDYWHSYRRYFDYTHLSRVVKSGGLRVTGNLDEMVEAVDRYLHDPSLDAEGRERVRRQQLFGLEGNSGKRAGMAILREMGLSARARAVDSLSIIIATKGRQHGLQKLFESLKQLDGLEQIQPEILVVNNADDGPPEIRVREMVQSLNGKIGNLHCLRDRDGISPRPKCRGHNLAIRAARGSILAFIDDDVELTPGWLTATLEFFRTKPYTAMQGAILMPPSVRNDEEFLKSWNRYRTIPYIDYGGHMDEIYTLTGPNMAIRREIFDEVGLFDERLGPGASGMSEDVEFAQRIVKHRGRIGYEPKAVVYHEADWDRLTDAFFRKWHEQQGRSRLLYKNSSLFSIIPNFNRSLATYAWYSLFSNERKKYRSLGRYYHYLAMLREKLGLSAQ